MVYDGPLTGITEQFGRSKLVHLQFADGDVPDDLEQFGEVTRREGPIADLKVDRSRVAEVLGVDPRPLHRGRHERAGPAARSDDRQDFRASERRGEESGREGEKRRLSRRVHAAGLLLLSFPNSVWERRAKLRFAIKAPPCHASVIASSTPITRIS